MILSSKPRVFPKNSLSIAIAKFHIATSGYMKVGSQITLIKAMMRIGREVGAHSHPVPTPCGCRAVVHPNPPLFYGSDAPLTLSIHVMSSIPYFPGGGGGGQQISVRGESSRVGYNVSYSHVA